MADRKNGNGSTAAAPRIPPVRLWVSTPSAHMHPAHVSSIDNLRDLFRARGWAMGVDRQVGDGVVRARNHSVARMRAHPFNATHFACVDDDVQFDPRDMVTMVEATIAGLDVVGGVYPKKLIDWHKVVAAVKAGVPAEKLRDIASPLCCNFEATSDEISDIAKGPERGTAELGAKVVPDSAGHHFVRVKDLPTGFMVCKRDVFEKMIAHYGDKIAYTPPPDATGTEMGSDAPNEAARVRWHKFFHMDTWEGNPESDYLSEDWWFCRQWQTMGGEVYAFAECRLIHYGSFAYSGCVADQLVLGDETQKGQSPEEDARASQASAE